MALTLVMLLIIVISIAMVCRSSIYGFVKYRYRMSKVPSFPRPAYPLIGHTYLLAGTPEKLFHTISKLSQEYWEKTKETLGIIWFGPIPIVFMLEPDGAEVILKSSRHMKKAFVYRFLHPWLGTGLLTSHGEKWKQRRRLITPSFHFSILQDFLDVMNEQSLIFVNNLKKNNEPQKDINLGKAITMCALDIICETAMGQSVNAQQDHDSNYVKALYR